MGGSERSGLRERRVALVALREHLVPERRVAHTHREGERLAVLLGGGEDAVAVEQRSLELDRRHAPRARLLSASLLGVEDLEAGRGCAVRAT